MIFGSMVLANANNYSSCYLDNHGKNDYFSSNHLSLRYMGFPYVFNWKKLGKITLKQLSRFDGSLC